MTRRQDGPGGYSVFNPLAYRKQTHSEIIKIESIGEGERHFSEEAAKRHSDAARKQKSDKVITKRKLLELFGGDEQAAEVVSNELAPEACKLLHKWSEGLTQGQLRALPDGLLPLFCMPVRPLVERHFELWFCLNIEVDRMTTTQRLRRHVIELLLAKSKKSFMNPHNEVSSFVSGLTAFSLYEIGFTAYDPSVISRLSQALRRNGKML